MKLIITFLSQHLRVPVEFERFDISGDTSEDAALFKQSMDSLRRNKVGLKGEDKFLLNSSLPTAPFPY